MGTAIVLVIVIAAAALCIRYLFGQKKNGGGCSGCSGKCGGCSGCGKCEDTPQS